MKKTLKAILIIACIILLLGGIMLVHYFTGRVPSNPDDLVGNTAGNLYNGGYFCQDENGTVFFANFYDNGTLYSMNADEGEIRKVSDAQVSALNTGGNYLYYYMSDSSTSTGLGFVRRVVGIYRCKKNGSAVTTLSREPAGSLLLVGDNILYQNCPDGKSWDTSIMNTDGRDKEILFPYCINPASFSNGLLYYNETVDTHFLSTFDMESRTENRILKYNVWHPVCVGSKVYFMDIENNYRLCVLDTITSDVKEITPDRVDFFNIAGEYIYYQRSSETDPALMRIRTDGTGEEVVANGVYNTLSVTDQYIYFRAFGNPVTIYHTPVHGSVNVSEFVAAKDAVSR